MGSDGRKISPPDAAPANRKRLAEAMRLQEIEGNPLDAEQVAMFELFEREGWPAERRREYILDRARRRAGLNAAE